MTERELKDWAAIYKVVFGVAPSQVFEALSPQTREKLERYAHPDYAPDEVFPADHKGHTKSDWNF